MFPVEQTKCVIIGLFPVEQTKCVIIGLYLYVLISLLTESWVKKAHQNKAMLILTHAVFPFSYRSDTQPMNTEGDNVSDSTIKC